MIPGLANHITRASDPRVSNVVRHAVFTVNADQVLSIAGTAHPTRVVALVVAMYTNTVSGAAPTITLATVDGNNVVLNLAGGSSGLSFYVGLIRWPTGDSITARVNVTGAGIFHGALYTLRGLKSLTKTASQQSLGAGAHALTLPRHGVVFGVKAASWTTVGTRTGTWTNMDSSFSRTDGSGRGSSMAYRVAGDSDIALSTTVSWNEAPNQGQGGALIAFR